MTQALDITTKLEVNIVGELQFDLLNLQESCPFILKYKCAALVTLPDYIAQAIAEKSKFGGRYKIITKIDDEKNFGIAKFKTLPRDIFGSDGFDITFAQGRSEREIENEIKTIKQFVEGLNPLVEIRFIVNSRDDDKSYMKSCAALLKNNPVSYIRTDPHVEFKRKKNLDQDHAKDIEFIKGLTPTKIKLSGNVSLSTIRKFDKIALFDVSLPQAKSIIKEQINEQHVCEIKQEIKYCAKSKDYGKLMDLHKRLLGFDISSSERMKTEEVIEKLSVVEKS